MAFEKFGAKFGGSDIVFLQVIFGPLESPQCKVQFDDHDKMI
jgi:hypothetical protein